MRVSRCFAFIDLSGFTALTARAGDERAVDVLSTFRALVRDVCSRRGVRIAKWLGDGAMLVGVETEPVVAALLEMQLRAESDASSMAIRCGITVGQVILHEGDDYIGHDVNLAARLCELAKGGEVMGAMAVAEHLPKWATVVGYDQIAVRGLDAPEREVLRRYIGMIQIALLKLAPYAGPDLRHPPHPRGGRQLRPRRPGPAAAVLLAELRRHVAAAAGTAPREPGEPPGPAHGTVSRARRAVPDRCRAPGAG